MNRTGKARLNHLVSRINGDNQKYQLDSNIAGYRLTTKGGNRDVSPRLKPMMMTLWLEAFEIGLDAIRAALEEKLLCAENELACMENGNPAELSRSDEKRLEKRTKVIKTLLKEAK